MRCSAAAAAAAAAVILLLVAAVAGATAGTPAAGGPGPTCPRRVGPPFLDALGSLCHRVRIEPSPPLEVRGDAFDKELSFRHGGASYSILFYAAWCPFSSKFRPTFEALSTMFPQIQHLAVEESSAMPSLFSRYGVRAFPAILLVNENTMVRYRGKKDLKYLVDFYKETTGLDPIAYVDVIQQESPGSLGSVMPGGRSLHKMAKDEPFVFLSVLFIILRVVAHFVPTIICHLRAFLIVRVWNLNDEDIQSLDTTAVPTATQIQGPITRARAKQLNYQVLSFFGTIPHIHENMMLPKSDMFVTLRNKGPSMDEEDKHWSMITNGGDGSKHLRIEDDAASGDFRTLKPP